MSYVPPKFMRTVAIIHDPKDQRPWVAVDHRTREPVLRLGDRDQLEQICMRFGWRIAATKVRRPRVVA
jgi:hypothetical protein